MDSITDSNRAGDRSQGRISTLISGILSALPDVIPTATMDTTQVNQAPTGQQTEEIIPQIMLHRLTTAIDLLGIQIRSRFSIRPYDLDGVRDGLIQIGQVLADMEQLDTALLPVTNVLADHVTNVCGYFATHVRQKTPMSPRTYTGTYDPDRAAANASFFRARQYFVEKFSWAIPSVEALEKIKEYAGDGKVLEIFAGSGLWTLLLRLMAVHVVSTDRVTKADGFAFVRAQSATEAVQSERDANLLFMCWAPYADPADYDALVEFHGEYVVTVSEGHGGCVGSDQFWEYLYDHYEALDHAEVPNWYGIHDHLEVWRRSIDKSDGLGRESSDADDVIVMQSHKSIIPNDSILYEAADDR